MLYLADQYFVCSLEVTVPLEGCQIPSLPSTNKASATAHNHTRARAHTHTHTLTLTHTHTHRHTHRQRSSEMPLPTHPSHLKSNTTMRKYCCVLTPLAPLSVGLILLFLCWSFGCS